MGTDLAEYFQTIQCVADLNLLELSVWLFQRVKVGNATQSKMLFGCNFVESKNENSE